MERNPDKQSRQDDLDNTANISISSASSNDSQGLNAYQKTTSKSGLSRMSSKLRIEKKREKRWKKNKIGKEDFFNKTTEFRTWLGEKKSIQLDTLTTPKAKTMFKKFVKKWNGKKLDQKYYNGLGVYWAAASPGAYDHNTVPVLPEAKSKEKLKASSFTPLYDQDFSTFGKKEGAKALRELQRMEGSTPTRPEDHVYDVPHSACSSFAEGTHVGFTNPKRTCTIRRSIKARPALSQLFQPRAEIRPPMLNSVEEPIYAKVTRQRPLSCVGRVQQAPGEPHSQSADAIESNGQNPVTMRQPIGLPPRPRTEYHDSHSSFGFMRKKTSTSSTDSDVSSCSSSTTLSSMSSLSSGVRSIVSESEYVTFGPTARTASRDGEYVSFHPKPPPRSSSIGSRSRELREVVKVVLAKVGATPTKEVPHGGSTEEGVLSPPPPSPPPPSSSSGGLDLSSDLLPPPPEFATGVGVGPLSPALPPPPSPLAETLEDPAVSSQALPPQTPVTRPTTHAEMCFPTPPLPPPPSPTPQLEPPPGPPGQDPLVTQVTPLPIATTRRRLMTPHHGPTPGPVMSFNGPNGKTQKRPSGEAAVASNDVTPAKKLDLDISYRSSYV